MTHGYGRRHDRNSNFATQRLWAPTRVEAVVNEAGPVSPRLAHALRTIPLVVLAALALLPAARAAASASQVTIMEDDKQLVVGSAAHRGAILDEMKSLGADIVKLRVDWRSVAPSPKSKTKPAGFTGDDSSQYPSGVWTNYDELIKAIVARGLRPYVMLGGASPNWGGGTGGRGGHPNPTEFKRFAQAVGSRYSGGSLPRVDLWSDWNEPDLKGWISPQYSSNGDPVSPRIYRALVYAAHDGLAASGHGGDQLLIGELQPGSQSGKANNKVSPIRFLREMACVDSNYHPFTGSAVKKHGCQGFKKLPGTGLAYHPYTFAGGPDVAMPNADDASIGQLNRVVSALDKITKAHRLQATRMPLWITEFGIQTNPPDQYAPPIKKVPGYLGESEWLAYRNPRVASYSQYPLLDDPIGGNNGGGFQSGLRTSSGKAKPGVYKAFKLPFFVQRRSDKVVEIFGGVRASTPGQKVTIESRIGTSGQFKAISGGTVQLNSQGYFDRVVQISRAMDRTYRFKYSGGTSRGAGVHH